MGCRQKTWQSQLKECGLSASLRHASHAFPQTHSRLPIEINPLGAGLTPDGPDKCSVSSPCTKKRPNTGPR